MAKKILIVDDQENMRLMLKLTFDEEDFELIEAATGLQAIEKAAAEKPDLIIMDIMMPGIDGYTAITRIRNAPGFKDIPFFIITAKEDSNFKKLSKVFGAVFHFTKPFDPEHILKKAKELLV
ncbi:response regulator [Candidatus Calescamantes bacterium]|nr:response regulator [Candidatus Calescamantes bacterium]MCK5598077.1 response regulator [bacterium]